MYKTNLAKISKKSFILSHFGKKATEYSADGFLKKNCDTITHELLNVLQNSEVYLLTVFLNP